MLLPRLKKLVRVVDPWATNVQHIIDRPASRRRPAWVRLGLAHLIQVEGCDLLVAVLDQEPPDNGTVCELAFASALGLPVIGYRDDKRTCGEEGVPMNLMILAAIERSGGVLTTSLEELISEVEKRI